MTAIECTAERPYRRDAFRDKQADLAQMYSRWSLWQGHFEGQIGQNSLNVQQMVPITGTLSGTYQMKAQTICLPAENYHKTTQRGCPSVN